MEEDETAKQTLERMGAARVRILLLSGNLLQRLTAEAVEWLAHLDEDDRSRSEASQASQMRTDLSTNNAAWIAAIAAIIAAVIAIVTIITTFISWAFLDR